MCDVFDRIKFEHSEVEDFTEDGVHDKGNCQASV